MKWTHIYRRDHSLIYGNMIYYGIHIMEKIDIILFEVDVGKLEYLNCEKERREKKESSV